MEKDIKLNAEIVKLINNTEYPELHCAVVVYDDFGEVKEKHMYAHDAAICKSWIVKEYENLIIYNPPYAMFLDKDIVFSHNASELGED